MTQYKNPIMPGFYPDPSICYVNGVYYLVNSTFAYFPGVPIFESRDLVHWKQIGNVLDREEQLPLGECGHSAGIYAPTLRYHDGTFYMITTNVSGGGNFIVTAENPAGPWSKPHYLAEAEGIDPSLFFDDDGRCYYCGTKGAPNARFFGDNVIYVREVDLTTFQLVGEEYHAWFGALKDCEWPEGPHIYKRNGYYYILHAEGGTSWDHAIIVARSKTIGGPYTGYKSNPVFTHRHLGHGYPVYAVGHADLAEDEQGNCYAVMLAMRPKEGCSNLGRETFLAQVTWENDWPVFNPMEGRLLAEGTISTKPYRDALGEAAGYDACTMYAFREEKLPYAFVTLHNPEKDMYRIDAEQGILSLKAGKHALTETKPVSYLGLRQTSFAYTAQTEISFTPDEGEEAGLAIVESNEALLRAALCGKAGKTVCKVIKTEGGKDQVLCEKAYTGDGAQLRLIAKDQHLAVLMKEKDGDWMTLCEEIPTHFLSTERAGGFVGCTIGMYASANGQESEHRAAFHYMMLQSNWTEDM